MLTWDKTTSGEYKATGPSGVGYTLRKTPGKRFILFVDLPDDTRGTVQVESCKPDTLAKVKEWVETYEKDRFLERSEQEGRASKEKVGFEPEDAQHEWQPFPSHNPHGEMVRVPVAVNPEGEIALPASEPTTEEVEITNPGTTGEDDTEVTEVDPLPGPASTPPAEPLPPLPPPAGTESARLPAVNLKGTQTFRSSAARPNTTPLPRDRVDRPGRPFYLHGDLGGFTPPTTLSGRPVLSWLPAHA